MRNLTHIQLIERLDEGKKIPSRIHQTREGSETREVLARNLCFNEAEAITPRIFLNKLLKLNNRLSLLKEPSPGNYKGVHHG